MAPPPLATAAAVEYPEETLEVRCVGCRETLEVERGLTEFVCPDCGVPQSLMPPRRRRALPIPRGAADARGARLPCGACGELLSVPVGPSRCACPFCGAELAVDPARLRNHILSSAAAAVVPLDPAPDSPVLAARETWQEHSSYATQAGLLRAEPNARLNPTGRTQIERRSRLIHVHRDEQQYPHRMIDREEIPVANETVADDSLQRNRLSLVHRPLGNEERHVFPPNESHAEGSHVWCLDLDGVVHLPFNQANHGREASIEMINKTLARERSIWPTGCSVGPNSVSVEKRNQVKQKTQKQQSDVTRAEDTQKEHPDQAVQEPINHTTHKEAMSSLPIEETTARCSKQKKSQFVNAKTISKKRHVEPLNHIIQPAESDTSDTDCPEIQVDFELQTKGNERRGSTSTLKEREQVMPPNKLTDLRKKNVRTNYEIQKEQIEVNVFKHTSGWTQKKRNGSMASSNAGLQIRRSTCLAKDSVAAVENEPVESDPDDLQDSAPNIQVPSVATEDEPMDWEPFQRRSASPICEVSVATANTESGKSEHEMVTRSLLSTDIDSKHRAALLEADPNSLETLVTRTPKSNWMIHPAWVERLKWAGLLPFARLVEATRVELVEGVPQGVNSTRLNYDQSLLTCLVDRWRPETHTFHFRWGEMAPTLQDVSYLLGLPLEGEPVGPLQAPAGWQQAMDARFHGIRECVGPLVAERHGPRLAWLQQFQIDKFGYPATQLTEPQITRCLEAYIMWLLGKTMFTENHVNTITARYIPIALEIADATSADDITPRSWGSAVLAATYRGMCNGCQLSSPKSSLLGCPLLLQLWSWERFPIGRPNILAEEPFPLAEVFDAERIDLPTFGTLWTRRKRRFAHDQVRNCYPVFTEQFDLLLAEQVIWEPYTEAIIEARYPCGISTLCTRDRAYWMTKSKIIFDISVEEMAQQRVMRQFGLCQLDDPPPADFPLPAQIHRLSRKGSDKTATAWLRTVQTYIYEWATAKTRVWPADDAFQPELFNAYLRRYMPATRLRLIQASYLEGMPAPATWDMYPSQCTAGSRQYAAELTSDLLAEVAQYVRQLSSGPLLGRSQQQSWQRHLEDKLQGIYVAITCACSSGVDHHRAAQRPPRPSTHQQQTRPRIPPRHFTHRQQPRPRLTLQATPRPPPPDQAGGSSWQQHTSFNCWQQQQQQPPFEGGG